MEKTLTADMLKFVIFLYNNDVYFYKGEEFYVFMKQKYASPELEFIRVLAHDVLTASDEDVFVDGGDLFDE